MTESNENHWPELICFLRRSLRLTLGGFAEELKVSPQTAWRWEHGKNKPRLSTQSRIMNMWAEATRLTQQSSDCRCLSYVSTYEIEADGRKATMRLTKTIVANTPMKSFLWAVAGEGSSESISVTPGSISNTFRDAGKTYWIQDFGMKLQVGQTLYIMFSCILRDSFVAAREFVAVEITVPTEQLGLVARLPKKRPPKTTFAVGVVSGEKLDLSKQIQRRDVKDWCNLSLQVDAPALRSTYTLGWTW